MIRQSVLGILGVCALSAPATAQSQTPPCQEDVYRAFDFWLGQWEVFTPDGKKAGDNVISSQENGCLLLEEWTSVQGGTGQSYNYYDPGMEKWRQVWVSGAATIDYAGGLTDEGAMALEGEIAYRNGNTAPFRGVWTLQEDGSVRQHFTQYDAEKDEWADWFIGIYRKKEDK
ncbi:MAG: hypothetical protein ACX939_03965 [Hyphococcus sp.]